MPLEIVEASGWVDVASGRWRYRDENIVVLEIRALTRGVEILASTQQLYRKRCVALVDKMAAALSFERRRSRNFLVMTRIRKLAGFCLALGLAVAVRWIRSEINVSNRPSRIHDPSDNRDKTVTNLLTTVVEKRTHRGKFEMARCDPRETASMIRSQNGTSRATSPETERGHPAAETEKTETVAAGWTLEGKQTEPITDVRSDGATDKQLEDTSRREECRRLERKEQRRHVFNGWRSEDKKKAKTFGTVSPGQSQGNSKIWRVADLANLSFLERVSVSHATEAKYRTRVEQFLGFADEEKLALVTDDEVDAAIVQHLNMSHSQGRCVSDGEVLLAELLFFQLQCGKLGGQKPARSRRALKGWRKRAPTRSRRPLSRMIMSRVRWDVV